MPFYFLQLSISTCAFLTFTSTFRSEKGAALFTNHQFFRGSVRINSIDLFQRFLVDRYGLPYNTLKVRKALKDAQKIESEEFQQQRKVDDKINEYAPLYVGQDNKTSALLNRIFAGISSSNALTISSCTSPPPTRRLNALKHVRVNEKGGHRARVFSLGVSPDESMLLSGCEDGDVLIWEGFDQGPITGSKLLTLRTAKMANFANPVLRVAWGKKSLAAGCENGTVQVWRPNLPDNSDAIMLHCEGQVVGLQHRPGYDNNICTAADSTVTLWDIRESRKVGEVTTTSVMHSSFAGFGGKARNPNGDVWAFAIGHMSESCLAVGCSDGSLRVMDLRTVGNGDNNAGIVARSKVTWVDSMDQGGMRDAVAALTCSPFAGHLVAWTSTGGDLGVWDARGGRAGDCNDGPAEAGGIFRVKRAHTRSAFGCEWAGPETLVTAGLDKRVRLWDMVATGDTPATESYHTSDVVSCTLLRPLKGDVDPVVVAGGLPGGSTFSTHSPLGVWTIGQTDDF